MWDQIKETKIDHAKILEALNQFDMRGRGWIHKDQFTKMLKDVGSIKVPHEQVTVR